MEHLIHPKEGFIASEFTHRQEGGATLQVHTLIYSHQQEDITQEITLNEQSPEEKGYGPKIFQGTLDHLVALVKEMQQTPCMVCGKDIREHQFSREFVCPPEEEEQHG